MDHGLRLGIDLGGTKTEGVIARFSADGDAPPDILARVRVPTERTLGYQHVLDAVASVIEDTRRQAGVSELPPIGVGMPGNSTRGADGALLVKNSNTTCLNGRPFFADLRRQVGRPIRFANDANCFALAEVVCGAARGSALTFGVILGTGVGGGVVIGPDPACPGARPRIWDGAQGIAGEWGHNALDPEHGPPCYCGRRGCVETLLSGPAIAARHRAATGQALDLPGIAAAAAAGDAAAEATLAGTVEWFGRALASVINILDPEVIVLGGGVSNLPIFTDPDRGLAALRRHVFSDGLATRVVRHQLGDSAGVLGAAWLAGAP